MCVDELGLSHLDHLFSRFSKCIVERVHGANVAFEIVISRSFGKLTILWVNAGP
jgi:hypothetical protein